MADYSDYIWVAKSALAATNDKTPDSETIAQAQVAIAAALIALVERLDRLIIDTSPEWLDEPMWGIRVMNRERE